MHRFGSFGLFLLLVALSACAPDEKLPPERTSAGLRMDGTHWIPIEGAPDLVDSTRPLDDKQFAGWSTAPVPLPTPYLCAVGTRNGRIYVYSEKGDVRSTIDMPEHEFVDQLLTANGELIAITSSGSIRSYSYEGKQNWNATAHGGSLTGNAVIANGLLVVPTSTAIGGFALRDGTSRWTDSTSLPCLSLADSWDQEYVVAAVSFNESGRQDSVIVMKALTGTRVRVIAAPGGRITSNIAVADKGALLLLGTLGTGDESGRAASAVAIKDWLTNPTTAWTHSLPYIILGMSANGDKAFASGFRNNGGELSSGIDAFKLEDTSFQWKRRFSEPLMTSPAVSEGNLFFTLSFETEAIVGARALLYTLKSGSGESVSERPLKASAGALPAMPMPDDQGRLLVADRERPVIYILDRSTLKRVF
jgi:hypothetical protein